MALTQTDRWSRFVAIVGLAMWAACATATGGTGGGAGGGADGGGDCQGLGPSRGASETCCPGLGIDACGANLICAALDGRTVPTCYPEHTRTGGQGCTDNALCVSGVCSTQTKTCANVAGEACTQAQGCGDPTGAHVVCAASTIKGSTGIDASQLACGKVASGPCGYCVTASDCADSMLTCISGRCVVPAGTALTNPSTASSYLYCCLKGGACSGSNCFCN